METAFLWLAASSLLFVVIVGVMLVLGSWRLLRLERIEPSGDDDLPKISVVVAARNEERDIEAGVLSVNSNSSVYQEIPFGGFKRSGFGRDLGMEAMRLYTEVKNVFIALPPAES